MSPNQAVIRTHLWISGKVQGVGYRLSAENEARKLGVNGWVKNLPDGRVEAVLEGEKAAVEQMKQWCRQGPTAAVVKDVQVQEESPENLSQFQVVA